MGKEKRKNRLDKGSAGTVNGEFLGFGAFSKATSVGFVTSQSSGAHIGWSPVYTGSDNQLSILFKKIGQKRDGNTKAKALLEMQKFFEDQQNSKKEKVTTLAHLIFVFHAKLAYDDSATVRAAALTALDAARVRLPKAWKTLLQQQVELLGMIWCARADESVEVKLAAQNLCNEITSGDDFDGLWRYATRILGYGRAKTMHDDIFARRLGDEPLTEMERDQLDERFERIVGTAISGVTLWVQSFPETASWGYSSRITNPILWKQLTGSRGKFRLKTYQLLGVMCQCASSAVYGDLGSKTLPLTLVTAVTQEKDPSNIPSLFEVILVYTTSGDIYGLDTSQLFKAVNKMLKKACYGASPSIWGPMMLPMLSSVRDIRIALAVISNLLGGREDAIGLSGSLLITSSAVECSAYLLLRHEDEEALNPSDSEMIASFWLESLHFYLVTTGVTPASRDADMTLATILGQTLCRLDEASVARKPSRINQCEDVFWGELLPEKLIADNDSMASSRFGTVIEKVRDTRKSGPSQSRLLPLLRRKFHDTLSGIQSHSEPTNQKYQLMRICLEFCSANYLFPSSSDGCGTDLKDFLMNDLLRWIVIHTSDLNGSSNRQTRTRLALHDFLLLRLCLQSIPSVQKQKALWGAVLRELKASRCDMGILAAGLREICEGYMPDTESNLAVIVKGEDLDNLSLQLVEDAVKGTNADASHELEDFLTTCSGLHPGQSTLLLSTDIVRKWVETACSVPANQVSVSVVSVLLECAKTGKLLLRDDTIKVTMLAWKLGGNVWLHSRQTLFSATLPGLRNDFLNAAGDQLRHTLVLMYNECTQGPSSDIETICKKWAERALRWFTVDDNATAYQKFCSVGLADTHMWRNAAKGDDLMSAILLRCATRFVLGIENKADRCSLLFTENQDLDRINLFAEMITSVSIPKLSDSIHNFRGMRCDSLLNAFGGLDMLSDAALIKCFAALVESLLQSLQSAEVKWTRKCLQGLSNFLHATIEPFLSPGVQPGVSTKNGHHLDASALNPGDAVWYVATQDQEDSLKPAKVIEIHTDDLPSLYFTIEVEKDGATEEKQTVPGRLRSSDATQYDKRDKELSGEKLCMRETIGGLLMEKIIRPYFDSRMEASPAAAEAAFVCMNIFVSQIGVLGKAGLGGDRYYLRQNLVSAQTQIVANVKSHDYEAAKLPLQMLSWALGCEEQFERSKYVLQFFNFDPTPSLETLVGAYGAGHECGSLDKQLLIWMLTSFSSIQSKTLEANVLQLIPRLVRRIDCETESDSLIAVYAMRIVSRSSVECASNDEISALSMLIGSFVNNWEAGVNTLNSSIDGAWWSDALDGLLVDYQGTRKHVLHAACTENASQLVSSLAITAKQWLAFRFLSVASYGSTPIRHGGSEQTLSPGTRSRLEFWKQGLIVDDAEELINDILAVHKWVPEALMAQIESWIEDQLYFDEAPEEQTVARMLEWLSFIQYLQSAAVDDVRNRAAFSSYASKCGGVFFILSACVIALNVDLDRSSLADRVCTIDDILRNRKLLEVSSLAAATLFHTIETFPAIARGWWEDDCPKSLTSVVNKFVQSRVAPETLRRELKRISIAQNLGEMTVRGSVVSREVTATYLQDDCTLSLVIEIPPNFPLRSVRVDGRRTLGIPENRFKRWALQIRQILSCQDGSVLDALLLWKRNVEKEFEGVEPCPVCYSVLSVKTHELPNLECKTCANRFHSSCLHKWFASSGKSQCVLCQQPWSASRIT